MTNIDEFAKGDAVIIKKGVTSLNTSGYSMEFQKDVEGKIINIKDQTAVVGTDNWYQLLHYNIDDLEKKSEKNQ